MVRPAMIEITKRRFADIKSERRYRVGRHLRLDRDDDRRRVGFGFRPGFGIERDGRVWPAP